MYDAPILKKAVEVLRLIVRQGRPLGTTDIARSLSFSKSTTFGILKSLDFKISSQIGTRMALTAGVVGKIFLSSMDNEEVLGVLERKGLHRYTANSIVDPDRYLEELEKTRAQGYAINREEFLKGVTAVAALIYSGHFPVTAVWVVGFSSSMGDEKLPAVISLLKPTAEQISTRLSPFVSHKASRER